MYGTLPEQSGTKLTLAYLFASYRRWSALIGFGSPNFGTALVIAALGFLTFAAWRARSSRTFDPVLVAAWLGVAVLVIWAAAFLNHTAVHPYFMARLLVIPVIGAAVLLLPRALSRRGAGA
jgi:hypothetical protein